MRTTLAIDDGLLATAKHRARQKYCTLGQLVDESLRYYLSTEASAQRAAQGPPIPISSRTGGFQPGVDLTSNAALYAFLDGEDLARDLGRA